MIVRVTVAHRLSVVMIDGEPLRPAGGAAADRATATLKAQQFIVLFARDPVDRFESPAVRLQPVVPLVLMVMCVTAWAGERRIAPDRDALIPAILALFTNDSLRHFGIVLTETRMCHSVGS